ncbi:MAG: peptidoglycan editing factor PgeF [Actinobacteria bacterium]|nr:peptidoglycan editing factor PgeF [Actinomycetota bacterium]
MLDEVDLGPGVLAGFTTRRGGVSRSPWNGFNLALHVGDDPTDVVANRAALERRVGAPVAFADQVHGTAVIVMEGPPSTGRTSVGAADALVTRSDAVALGVLVADCVPVLLADAHAGVVAVAHAGRAGLAAGVISSVLAAMAGLGARPARVRAVLGPCIAGRSYEVPAALRDEVAGQVPGTAATTAWGTPALDLAAGARRVLLAAGVQSVAMPECDTFTDERLFSHRRDGPATGRFAGVVRLRRG